MTFDLRIYIHLWVPHLPQFGVLFVKWAYHCVGPCEIQGRIMQSFKDCEYKEFHTRCSNYKGNLRITTFMMDKGQHWCVTFGLPSFVSFGDVFWTSRSFVKGYFYIPLRIAYAFEVELMMPIHVVFHATTIGWQGFVWSRHSL